MKRTEMIPGKWYKWVTCYGKFLRLAGNRVVVSETNINGYVKGEYSDLAWFKDDEIEEATIEELKRFLPKDHPDLQINRVVHCTIQQEWDFVLSKLNNYQNYPKKNQFESWNCIDINKNLCDDLNFYQKNNYTILSFEDWCKENNYTPDWLEKNEFKEGDYIVFIGEGTSILKTNYCHKIKKNGNAYEVEKDIHGDSNYWEENFCFNKPNTWRYATKEEIAEYDRLGKPYDVTTLNKTLTVNDLVEGEVYYTYVNKVNTLFNCNKQRTIGDIVFGYNYISDISLCSEGAWVFDKTLRLATNEEKEWFNKCLEANKFIPKEEAKKFSNTLLANNIPEYVELLPGWSCNNEYVGKIFDTKKDFQSQFEEFKQISPNWNWEFIFNNYKTHGKYFKPSTKEAYNSQFNKSEMEYKFNIGDEVNVTNKGKESCNFTLKASICSNELYKSSIIIDRKYNDGYNWYELKDYSNWFTEEDLKLVENEEWIPKVGDWVVITQQGYEDQGCVQLTDIDKHNKSYFKTSCYIEFKPSQFRKAEPHEIPPGMGFTKMTLTFKPDLVWEIDPGLPVKTGSGLEQIQQNFKLLDVDTSLY